MANVRSISGIAFIKIVSLKMLTLDTIIYILQESVSTTAYHTAVNTLLGKLILYFKMTAFWDIVPCSFVGEDRRFRGAYCLHHQGDDDPDDGGSTHS
jgi:hypothetical protein